MLKPLMLSALVERVKDIVENRAQDFPNQKIEQIKALRAATNFGLKHSKDIVEFYINSAATFNPNSRAYENLIEAAIEERYVYLEYGDRVVKDGETIALNAADHLVVWDSNSGKGHYVCPTEAEAIRFKEFLLSTGNYWDVRVASVNWQ